MIDDSSSWGDSSWGGSTPQQSAWGADQSSTSNAGSGQWWGWPRASSDAGGEQWWNSQPQPEPQPQPQQQPNYGDCSCKESCTVIQGTNLCYVKGKTSCSWATESYLRAGEAWIPCPSGDETPEPQESNDGDCSCKESCTVIQGTNLCYVKGKTSCSSATESYLRPGEAWIPCP